MQSKSTLKITGALLALSLIVNQHAILTPYRHPILTPSAA